MLTSEAVLVGHFIEQLARAGYEYRICYDEREVPPWCLLSIPDLDGRDEVLSAGVTLPEALSSYAKKVL